MHVFIDVARRGRSWVAARDRCVGDQGANLVEYAMLLAFIAVICIVAVTFLGTATCDNADDARLSAFGAAGGSNCP
jgi:Flp pilus assembly pilin Flp